MKKEKKYITDKSHLKDEYISLYIDALILDKVNELPNEIINHVEECLDCKQNILEGYDILKKDINIKNNSHPYFNNQIKKINFQIIYRIAASVVILFSIATITYIFNNPQQTSNQLSQQKEIQVPKQDTLNNKKNTNKQTNSINERISNKKIISKEEEIKHVIAENKLTGKEFQISPVIITMIGTRNRSDYLEVEYPKDSAIFNSGEQIIFKWKSDVNEDIILKIFDYENKLIFTSETLDSNLYNCNKLLNPGVYVWKIEGEFDLYHLGVFFIRKKEK